jgi:tetraacyldisaccharide 4'-kinase
VTAALALALKARGLKVGILAWRIGKGRGRSAAQLVSAASDWRFYSDEAVLLARETGCPVFAVRDRAAAWRELAGEPFDLLLSDDGFQDRRLKGAFRILLAAPGEAPRFRDLLPAGPFRERAAARERAQLILEGPWPERTAPIGNDAPDKNGALDTSRAGFPETAPAGAHEGAHRFWRGFRLPFLPEGRPILALATLGDPDSFLSDLQRAGVRPAALIRGRNHRDLPYAAMRAAAKAYPGALILCTPKEAVRMDGHSPYGLEMVVASQQIQWEERTVERVLDACRSFRSKAS